MGTRGVEPRSPHCILLPRGTQGGSAAHIPRPGPCPPSAPHSDPTPGVSRFDEKAQARQRGPQSGARRALWGTPRLRLSCALPGSGPASPFCRRLRGFGAWCHVDTRSSNPNRKGWGKGGLPPPCDPARPLPAPRPGPGKERPLLALESLIGAGLPWKQGFLWDFSLHQQQHRKPES